MDYYAFTTRYGALTSKIITEAKIIYEDRIYHSSLAQWDTGATNTCISKSVVNALNLTPIGIERIHTPSGEKDVNTYLVDIVLRNNVTIQNLKVNDSEIAEQGIDMLIGMDVIKFGDFSITNVEGKTTFTFRIPSIKEIDYVEECGNI